MRKQTIWAAPQRLSNLRRLSYLAFFGCIFLLFLLPLGAARAEPSQSSQQNQGAGSEGGISVMQSFNNEQNARPLDKVLGIPNHEKGVIMFIMGTALLIAVITTASLGMAMVLHGKEVFLAHMISAGISVFLAIAHAVVAVVWFFPF